MTKGTAEKPKAIVGALKVSRIPRAPTDCKTPETKAWLTVSSEEAKGLVFVLKKKRIEVQLNTNLSNVLEILCR